MDTTVPSESGNEPNLTGSAPVKPLIDPRLNTYDLVKAEFEKTCFKVNDPFCYVRTIGSNAKPQFFTHRSIQEFFCHLKYFFGSSYHPFVPRWLKDPTKRTVETIELNKEIKRLLKRAKKSV